MWRCVKRAGERPWAGHVWRIRWGRRRRWEWSGGAITAFGGAGAVQLTYSRTAERKRRRPMRAGAPPIKPATRDLRRTHPVPCFPHRTPCSTAARTFNVSTGLGSIPACPAVGPPTTPICSSLTVRVAALPPLIDFDAQPQQLTRTRSASRSLVSPGSSSTTVPTRSSCLP